MKLRKIFKKIQNWILREGNYEYTFIKNHNLLRDTAGEGVIHSNSLSPPTPSLFRSIK